MCHPTAMYIVFEIARKVISLVDSNLFQYWKAEENDTISAINECNVPLACELINNNEEMFKDILMSICYQDKDKTTVVYNTFMLGIEELIDNPDKIIQNWGGSTSNGRIYYLNNNKNFDKLLKIKL
jgi:hypothetical protein